MRVIALALLLAACGGSSKKPAPAEPAPETEPSDADQLGNVAPEETPAEPPAATEFETTGAPVCDELIVRVKCSYDKAGADMPAEALKAFTESIQAWKDALANDATRQATIDACQMSLDAAQDGFAGQGC